MMLSLAALVAVAAPPAVRPLATYSIVARDAASGELGVAVQSHWFSVGSVVSWAEAGVGAVATQSFAEPAYGALGLELMRAGKSAGDALKALLAVDEQAATRQVAMVDSQGRVAAHTGASCIQAAGHQLGEGYSVQANLLASERVWPAMARGFEAASGPLAERLLAALEAAEKAGGDIRGRQSAALVVVKPASSGRPWADRLVDLRVDDSREPLVELRRLLDRHRAYEHMNRGDEALAKGDSPGALAEYAAAARLVDDEPEIRYWQAVTLASAGELDKALAIFREVFALEPRWIEVTRRLVPAGLMEAELAERVIERAKPAGSR